MDLQLDRTGFTGPEAEKSADRASLSLLHGVARRAVADGFRHLDVQGRRRLECVNGPRSDRAVLRQLTKGSNVIHDENRAPMGSQNQVAVPRVHQKVPDGHRPAHRPGILPSSDPGPRSPEDRTPSR